MDDALSGFDRVTEWLQHAPGADLVYGDPVERDDRTVVPVARVRYRVAGGFGAGTGDAGDDTEASEGGGGGGLGDATATPVGVVEVSDAGTRVVRFDRGWRRGAVGAALGAAAGMAVGLALGRRG
ncbi:GerW family sporulation protein [Halorarius halobius]|uniref:GerW family sporulation protein n=1 Tax=Halorarius halobius TaxID=2962671 RepID=UPI0020CBAD10|nr:spore germination protein GerW family protein [Halorarius halobius]